MEHVHHFRWARARTVFHRQVVPWSTFATPVLVSGGPALGGAWVLQSCLPKIALTGMRTKSACSLFFVPLLGKGCVLLS